MIARRLVSWLQWALPLPLGLVGGTACNGAGDETCEVQTSEISTVALVVDSGFDIRVAVDFELGDRQGPRSPVSLCESDTLTINGATPTSSTKATRVEYSLAVPVDGERRFEFVLEREAESETIAFEIELPPAFEILTPMDGDPLQVGEVQSVTWEPSLGEQSTMLVGLTEALGGGQCLLTPQDDALYESLGGVPVPDTGQWEVKNDEIGSDSPVPCAATYTLTRLVLGDYPTQFERGGRVEARVERYRDIEVTP